MARLDVRCKVDLPVSILLENNGRGITEQKARFSSLSLSGGFIDYKPPHVEKKIIGLRYNLPRHGEFEILGEILRIEKDGLAARFYDLNRDARLKLWDYLKENLTADTTCPYCGKENIRKVIKCDTCGWNQNLYTSNYIVEHEKESFLERLALKSKSFSLEDIYRILNFVDVEILKVGKNLEINEELVGSSKGMLDVFSMLRKAATADVPVLITGENGTGKESTAIIIHERSRRKNKPFVPINCAAVPANLLEAELFGYEKVTLAGDLASKAGKFEYADGGTIFLDEIGKLPANLQSKLLKFSEDMIVERIGAKGGKKVDVRLIAATDTDLKSAAAKGIFIKDLLYKLGIFPITLPPVRERGDDKIILARYFLNKFSKEVHSNKTFTHEAIDSIKNYDWPGNVREIINKVRRAVLMSTDTTITPADLDLNIPTINTTAITSLKEAKRIIEKQKLIEAIRSCNNNISKAARVLGISRPSVYNMKKKYGI